MNISSKRIKDRFKKIRDWTFDKVCDIAHKTQEKSFRVVWIPLLIYIPAAIFLPRIINILYIIAVFGVLAIFLILWYLISWPLYLIDEIKKPRDIPEDTQHHYDAAESKPPRSRKESAEYEIKYMDTLIYTLKRRMFRTVLRIIVVFLFIILIFGNIFEAVDKIFPNGSFGSIGEDDSFLKYVYYSLVTFTTVGFGDMRPEGANSWRYTATAFEMATSIAYVVLTLTMVASCIFVQYSIRKEHFSLFLGTLDKDFVSCGGTIED